jgi:hypothetical protein
MSKTGVPPYRLLTVMAHAAWMLNGQFESIRGQDDWSAVQLLELI